MTQSKTDYHVLRARMEREAAANARTEQGRNCHARLATLHEEQAEALSQETQTPGDRDGEPLVYDPALLHERALLSAETAARPTIRSKVRLARADIVLALADTRVLLGRTRPE